MLGNLMKLALDYLKTQFASKTDGRDSRSIHPPRQQQSVQVSQPSHVRTPQEAQKPRTSPAPVSSSSRTVAAKREGVSGRRKRTRGPEKAGPRAKFTIVEPTAADVVDAGDAVLAKIAEDARLRLPDFGKREHYELLSKDSDGIESRFDEDDYENELLMGLDFGTSSVKVVLTEPATRTLAVPFVKASGIDAYLLPTILYETDDGAWTLVPTHKIVSKSIKLDFLNNPAALDVQLRAAGFLALVIRHVRAWLFTSHPYEFQNGLSWEAIMGYPSTEDDEESRKLWRELLFRSWNIAGTEGEITPDVVRKMLQADGSELDVPADYFRAEPEVLAEAHAFIANRPKDAPGQGVYFTIVDVGSGTLDISSFGWSQHSNNRTWHLTPFITSVDRLGTTDTHHKRLQWLKSAISRGLQNGKFSSSKDLLSGWIREIDENLKHALCVELPEDVRRYYDGMNFRGLMPNEEKLSMAVFNHLFRNRYHCHAEKGISPEVVHKMKVLLCGGGARAGFYRRALSREDVRYSNYTWVRPSIENLTPIRAFGRDGLPVPIRPVDHDRLLVAYGLVILENYTVMSPEIERRGLPHAPEAEIDLTDKSSV